MSYAILTEVDVVNLNDEIKWGNLKRGTEEGALDLRRGMARATSQVTR